MKEIQTTSKLKDIGQTILVIPAMLMTWLLMVTWISFLFSIPVYILYKLDLLSFLPTHWGFLNCWLAVATVLIGVAVVYWCFLAILSLIAAIIGSLRK